MRREALEEGTRWLEQAIEDLKWTKELAERGGYHIACFLAQQVGDKALKAFLYAQGEEMVIGHSAERLCHFAARFDAKLLVRSRNGQFWMGSMSPPDIRTACPIASRLGSSPKTQPKTPPG